jgi:hypothetical protein
MNKESVRANTKVPVEEDEPDRWISAQEAKALLCVGASKLRELRTTGIIEERKLGYRTLRFSLKSVRDFIRKRTRPKRSRGSGG